MGALLLPLTEDKDYFYSIEVVLAEGQEFGECNMKFVVDGLGNCLSMINLYFTNIENYLVNIKNHLARHRKSQRFSGKIRIKSIKTLKT